MAFEMRQKVLFRHCDPAGIVFFPRYFEMMNDCVEQFFAEALDAPFERLHKSGATPTAQIETRFARPSRHGDMLALALTIAQIGRSSAAYRMTAHCDDELRFETSAVLVYVDKAGRPASWPEAIRAKLRAYEESEHDA